MRLRMDIQVSRIKNFISLTQDLPNTFYKKLIGVDSQYQEVFHQTFFKDVEFDTVEKEYATFNPDESIKEHLWSKVNNGLKYTMVFDYVGSTQEFEGFSCLKQIHRKNIIEDIELFVRYPGNDEIYFKVLPYFMWKEYVLARITDDSSMALCLNHSRLWYPWQRQFHKYLLEWRQKQRFSPGVAIGLGSNMAQSLNQISKNSDPKLHGLNQFFQNKLREFNYKKSIDILFDGSGNGPLIRSAGNFDIYLQALRQYIDAFKGVPEVGTQFKLSQEEKNKFEEILTYLFMMDQHNQSSLTHYGMQGQISTLLLAWIQIKLIFQQQLHTKSENLLSILKDLIRSFRDDHFAKIIDSYFEGEVDSTKIIQKMNALIKQKQNNSYEFEWQKYLNINNRFDINNLTDQQILEDQLLILYYSLFYENEDKRFLWEDPHFVEYLSQKRSISEGFNCDLSNPSHNQQSRTNGFLFSNGGFYTPQNYNQFLQKGDSGYFGAYSPDCLCIVFYILSKGREKNRDIFDMLLDICDLKGDCDSYGAVLGTLLASYDFSYHENYKSDQIQNRDDFMNHFKRIDLKTNDVIKDILFSKYYMMSVLPKTNKKGNNQSDLFFSNEQ